MAKRGAFFRTQIRASENGAGPAGGAAAAAVAEEKVPEKEESVSRVGVASSAPPPVAVEEPKVEAFGSVNGAAGVVEAPVFKDKRWVGGTWDLARFEKDGKTNWDAVIDAGKTLLLLLPFLFFFTSVLFRRISIGPQCNMPFLLLSTLFSIDRETVNIALASIAMAR